MNAPIGVFDSGYGGLTILKEIRSLLPQYDYIYLGDNARAPYGSRSSEVVYKFTKQAVDKLFGMGCPLVILACNTASARALRTIQQQDLPFSDDPTRRVLGVIRPTVESIDQLSHSRHVGVLATRGTVSAHSYKVEIAKLFPEVKVSEEACPMWVPLVENGESNSPGADYFIRKHLFQLINQDDDIDAIILGCTHYPLLMPKMKRLLTPSIRLIPQGEIVAKSLADYLIRHPEMEQRLSKMGHTHFLTTENPEKFSDLASIFLQGQTINAEHTTID
ncbi:glutamate racemase [Falsiporphyromonas endometrii]|uniref:Glutamate racemase n=1 Tax=Falsiporphyromonas endometrii TaxID=1387297 RepID=A0ABV9K7C8_9PORP|nr:glutamate racemase [Porphyromonadaceae bacterium]